jgi:hypothetical protein
MAPDCKFGARKRYVGSNPTRPKFVRALHSGSASAFQADSAGSIPAARSRKALFLQGFSVRIDATWASIRRLNEDLLNTGRR